MEVQLTGGGAAQGAPWRMPRGERDALDEIKGSCKPCFDGAAEFAKEGTEVLPPSGDEGAELGEQGLRMNLPPLLAKRPLVGNSEKELEVSGLLLVEDNKAVEGGQVGNQGNHGGA